MPRLGGTCPAPTGLGRLDGVHRRYDHISVTEGVCDITIIGGGPVGLAAAYYAGHRDASVSHR